MTVPTRDIINATGKRAAKRKSSRGEGGCRWCLLFSKRARFLHPVGSRPTGRKRKRKSKPVAERGETSRTIISDRGSRGRLGPSRYPRHGAQRDVIARVETAANRVYKVRVACTHVCTVNRCACTRLARTVVERREYLLGEDEREKRRSGNEVKKEREENRIRIHIGTLSVYVENGRILHSCKVFIGRKRGKTRRSIPKSAERLPPLASTIQSELRFRVSSVAFMSVRSRPMLGVVRLSLRRLARVSFMPRRVSSCLSNENEGKYLEKSCIRYLCESLTLTGMT